MTNNDSFDLMRGTLEGSVVCQNYVEYITYVKNLWKLAKMANFVEKLGFLWWTTQYQWVILIWKSYLTLIYVFVIIFANIGPIWKI